jgi:hypothetical protein
MGPKRPHFTPQEIDDQLQQVYLSTDFLGSQNESLEQLALIIRNIHASRQQDAYLRHLDAYIKDKEAEIEEVCKTNYQVSRSATDSVCRPAANSLAQDFAASTDKLLRVRKNTASLRHRVVELNEDIQSKGGQVASRVGTVVFSKQLQVLILAFCSTIEKGTAGMAPGLQQYRRSDRNAPSVSSRLGLVEQSRTTNCGQKVLFGSPRRCFILLKILLKDADIEDWTVSR